MAKTLGSVRRVQNRRHAALGQTSFKPGASSENALPPGVTPWTSELLLRQLSLEVVAGQVLQDVERFAAIVGAVVDVDRTNRLAGLDGSLVQVLFALADVHPGGCHGFADPDLLIVNGLSDPRDLVHEECVVHAFGVFLRELIKQPPSAAAPYGIRAVDPRPRYFQRHRRFGQRRVARRKYVREISALQLLDLRFGLFARDLLGIVDAQTDQIRIVVFDLLESSGQLVIFADLFGEL